MAIVRCPHCGQEIKNPAPTATNSDLYQHISNRLAQYDWPGMSPEKHVRINAIRSTIKVIVPELPKGMKPMPIDVYERAIKALDQMLPQKEATNV